MSLSLWLLYVSLSAAVIASPGPSALLCVSHSLRHGPRKAVATIIGGITASMTLMLLSALGLGAVIAASDTLFQAIKWTGAAYLLYLGISTWRSANHIPIASTEAHTAQAVQPADTTPEDTATAWQQLYRKGLMVGLGNPKDLLFFSALFPQFVDASAPVAGQLAILGTTWMVLDGSIMLAYVYAGAKLLSHLHGSRAGQWFDRATGGAFVAAAGMLAASQR